MNHETSLATLVMIYLGAMIVAVPLARRLGLGAVLGYLIVGVALGAQGLGWIGRDQEQVLHLAEFGVIMMLFLIGLELRLPLLMKLRGPIFGMGGLHLAGSAAALGVVAWLGGSSPSAALVAGLILSLSSTAIVLQSLQEEGMLKSAGGESAFSVLLFQDMAVIPMIALMPLLAPAAAAADSASGASGWLQAAKVIGAVVALILAGKFLLQPAFHWIAQSRMREIFTATALLLVLAVTQLMTAAGVSPAMGAFLAGVILAESEYRHELEADIEPFKGLLLGVFFISVGAGIDLRAVARSPVQVGALVAALLALKAAIGLAVGRAGKLGKVDSSLFALSLAQGGEFAFVLIAAATAQRIFDAESSQVLSASVALSMVFAPLLIKLHARVLAPRLGLTQEREADPIDEQGNPVIIAGFGRFGQMVSRLLRACGIKATILDHDVEQVEVLKRFGMRSYYGDAGRMELLHAAGAAQAKLLLVCIDDFAKATQIAEEAHREFPNLKILVRAYDRVHAYELIHKGFDQVFIETSGSALHLGVAALRELGFRANQAELLGKKFRNFNDQSIRQLASLYHEAEDETFISRSKDWMQALEKMLQTDVLEVQNQIQHAWESPPRSFGPPRQT